MAVRSLPAAAPAHRAAVDTRTPAWAGCHGGDAGDPPARARSSPQSPPNSPPDSRRRYTILLYLFRELGPRAASGSRRSTQASIPSFDGWLHHRERETASRASLEAPKSRATRALCVLAIIFRIRVKQSLKSELHRAIFIAAENSARRHRGVPMTDQTMMDDAFEQSGILETPSAISASEIPEDLSLCFLCMRWAAGDPSCRPGHRCDLQLVLDRL
jgi:hypothetical protein